MSIQNKILVVCHDAGGAEIVSAYVKEHSDKYHFYCVVDGPAKKIFASKKLNKFMLRNVQRKNPEAVIKKLPGLSMVLTGTSWSTSHEVDFIRAAKAQRIQTISYLDHWVNYKERFGFPHKSWLKNLPDEIWVGDKEAFRLAQTAFKNITKIKLVPNLFFHEIKQAYRRLSSTIKQKTGMLIATEPITAPRNYLGDSSLAKVAEYELVEQILEYLAKQKYQEKIIIRLHPSEPAHKYDKILKKFLPKLTIVRSHEPNMFRDLAKVRCVIGMESMFLVVAMLCKKKVISFLPDKNKECPLLFKEIVKIKNIKQLISLL